MVSSQILPGEDAPHSLQNNLHITPKSDIVNILKIVLQLFLPGDRIPSVALSQTGQSLADCMPAALFIIDLCRKLYQLPALLFTSAPRQRSESRRR